DLELRQKYNVNLVLIKRNSQAWGPKSDQDSIIHVPTPDTVVQEGDILLVAGSDADLAHLPQQ
ncbi:MAG: TrkA C-terminal domain-containing protein, partial [Planctomycetes bacterium]|nr:TrkA C-terminal domain-containing protein [Planctomycetota bacterium]